MKLNKLLTCPISQDATEKIIYGLRTKKAGRKSSGLVAGTGLEPMTFGL